MKLKIELSEIYVDGIGEAITLSETVDTAGFPGESLADIAAKLASRMDAYVETADPEDVREYLKALNNGTYGEYLATGKAGK